MKSCLLIIEPGEENYLKLLKPIIAGKLKVHLSNVVCSTYSEALILAKEKGADCIATTSEKLLLLLMNRAHFPTKSSFTSYLGSMFIREGIEFLIVPKLEWLVTVSYGGFLYERYFNKYIYPTRWLSLPEFKWDLFQPQLEERMLDVFSRATFISSDIETGSEEERVITCIGFTAVQVNSETRSFSVITIVVPFDDAYNIAFARKILRLAELKVFQNGKYDVAYLIRYNSPPTAYAGDTANLFHCWYSELPKDLGFIVGFVLRGWEYWKHESETQDKLEYYGYNAKDAFTTAMSFLAILLEYPDWAWRNYFMEFPTVYPCILGEATGIKADIQEMETLESQVETIKEFELNKLRSMVGCEFYNPNSSRQTQKLFHILGCKDIESTGKIGRDKVASRHPINKLIMNRIEWFREQSKLLSTYTDQDKLWNGRIYYAINPHGTDTGRLASRESHFWCGLQIQNIPRDREDIQIKSYFIADEGFYFGEADGEQAEARDVAYLSGDANLIETVEGTRDYHAVNVERFFGVPYERVIGPNGKQLDKKLRDLSKRVNHGSNYNMGPNVLIDTMGIEKVLYAKKVLNLPHSWSLFKVAEYLLERYKLAYPAVKGAYYDKIKKDIAKTGFLSGPTGWTRYCFGDPSDNKRDLNRYVAHPSQSLNAMVLNKAWVSVFYNVWLNNQEDFKLCAQIHDSILFQYRIGREDLALQVKKQMEITVPVTDTFGETRNLLVPVALKGGSKRWSEIESLKT